MKLIYFYIFIVASFFFIYKTMIFFLESDINNKLTAGSRDRIAFKEPNRLTLSKTIVTNGYVRKIQIYFWVIMVITINLLIAYRFNYFPLLHVYFDLFLISISYHFNYLLLYLYLLFQFLYHSNDI